MNIYIYLFSTIFMYSTPMNQNDSLENLYKEGNYKQFLNESQSVLKKTPELKYNYSFLLKLAYSAYKLKKYDLSKAIYVAVSLRDSLLDDYVQYFQNIIDIEREDTLRTYKSIEALMGEKSHSYLEFNLLKRAINITNKRNEKLLFLRYINFYAKYQKLSASTAIKRLAYIKSELTKKGYLREQLDFLKTYENSNFCKSIIDSIYMGSTIDSIENKDLYDLIASSVQQHFLDKSLMQYYYRIENLDTNSQIKLDYIISRKKSKEAISLIQKIKKKTGKNTIKYARSLPRLYLKINQINKAYKYYLEFARLYPNDPFSLNAVTFILGRTEKKDPEFFRKILTEFVNQDSKYKQYYRFRHILYFYEKKDLKKALELNKIYASQSMTSYQKYRLIFWEAKFLFELNRRKEAFNLLADLAKTPFNSYYNIKSYISLIENDMENVLITLPNIRLFSLQSTSFYFSNLKRLKMIRNVYGNEFFNREFRESKFPLSTESNYHNYINFLIRNELFHRAFQASIHYSYKIKKKQLLRSKFDIQDLLFPTYFQKFISENADRYKIDKSLIFALVRRESAFQSDVKSSANAYGLMQLLEPTGRAIARKINLKMTTYYDLFRPEFNIQLGTYYLRNMLNRFDNKFELALAAYNAGASKVKRWIKKFPAKNAELFIEKIPFEQTRSYVKKVMLAYYAYRVLDKNLENIYYSGIKSRN